MMPFIGRTYQSYKLTIKILTRERKYGPFFKLRCVTHQICLHPYLYTTYSNTSYYGWLFVLDASS